MCLWLLKVQLIISGFEGDHCETNIDECELYKPCDGGATCIDTPGSYKCQCPYGFGGKRCEDVSYNV